MCLLSLALATFYSLQRNNTMTNEGPRISLFGLFLVFLTPALGGFLFGYDIGCTSFVLLLLRGASDCKDCWYKNLHHSPIQQGLLVSAVSLGALIGSHIVLVFLVQRIGRRCEIRTCSVLYLIGTFLNVLSGTILQDSIPMIGFSCLILGRLIYGVGVGFIMHGVCVGVESVVSLPLTCWHECILQSIYSLNHSLFHLYVIV